MVQEKTWEEFRETGLMLFVNSLLHIFGWALVFEIEREEIKCVSPARVKFRGFDEKSVTEAYIKVSQHMVKNSMTLLDEASAE